jgi:uncharacterized protein (DUF608 family)
MACDPQECDCRPEQMRRRDFLAVSTLAAASLLGDRPVMAGPFEENEYLKTIPVDKKLRPEWVRSLFERGEKRTHTDPASLAHIGMPVGGLFAGTVYLSGDGRLWLWDIFNRDQEGIVPRQVQSPDGSNGIPTREGANYVRPAAITQPFDVGFSLRTDDRTRNLDATGFSSVTFDGRYPIGRVTFQDSTSDLTVRLEAFSPFIPLNAEDSSLPSTILSYTLTNAGSRAAKVEFSGHLANPVCLHSGEFLRGERRNQVVREEHLTAVVCDAVPVSSEQPPRPDIRFEDFERATYDTWTTEGTAFGDAPIALADVPAYQGQLGAEGQRAVNSHASAPGQGIPEKDAKTGKLISNSFTIERRLVSLRVGGGSHKDRSCVNVVVEGQVVATVTGQNDNRMKRATLDVSSYEGRKAHIEVIDDVSEAWGNVGVDEIVFTDAPPDARDFDQQADVGTMVLARLGAATEVTAAPGPGAVGGATTVTAGLRETLKGQITESFSLGPGESKTMSFVIAWHFPNFHGRGVDGAPVGHRYAARFRSALDVVRYLNQNLERLSTETRTWTETWYDSTLPYWLLDRTMANTSTLATTTCYRFADGRFWAWEGVGCCQGTCTHVWHYAQAVGRLFPEVERDTRERIDFGLALHADGAIGHRASLRDSTHSADDGQCGRILGAYREHQTSTNDDFLKRIWPQVKRAIEFLIRKDGNSDGMMEDAQPNTLDAAWYGKVSFLASLYLAALHAGEAMAREIGDETFAAQCRAVAERGSQSILECYDGEYFAQLEDPGHRDAIGIGPGCYIDQVFGQTWAHWVGLGRLFDRERQLSALRALWKYNFVPDIGAFRKVFSRGRWYAMAGDAGLIMCSWPKGGQNPNFATHWQSMYFNECMTGFEWQAAAHMIWEGWDQPDLLQNGLAVSRAIDDRYDARLRNPYNEIECSDHYARAMASYGVFLAVCGYEYHGPRGHLGFSPRVSPTDFRCPFTAAEGWGTFSQRRDGRSQHAAVEMRWGRLRLQSIALEVDEREATSVSIVHAGRPCPARLEAQNSRVLITLAQPVVVEQGAELSITVELA